MNKFDDNLPLACMDEKSCECDCHMFLGGSGKACPDCIKHGCAYCTKDDGGNNGN